jgi:hypothetical protein
MKPTASPVARASGTLTIGVRSVENRNSEKIGASAPSKNAVLRRARKGSPRNRA